MAREMHRLGPLVSPAELHRLISAGQTVALDATYFSTSEGRNAKAEFERSHIPGARFFDIEAIARHDVDLPHMLPHRASFEMAARDLGISEDHNIVVYDRPRLRSAPRAWWMFRYFGHDNVSVLDGGFEGWRAANLPLEAGPSVCQPGGFRAKVRPAMLRSLDDALRNAADGSELYLDARPFDRFIGRVGDSWTERRGHIRNCASFPSSELLNDAGNLKPKPELKAAFSKILDGRPVVTTCGSGIAACLVAFALHAIGEPDAAVFDGSWAEWGNDARTEAYTVPPA